jgi:hypothetical protein
LTGDQGWRIEVKQYQVPYYEAPTEEETLIETFNDTPQQYDGALPRVTAGLYTRRSKKK